jgi:hypothetical protein
VKVLVPGMGFQKEAAGKTRNVYDLQVM